MLTGSPRLLLATMLPAVVLLPVLAAATDFAPGDVFLGVQGGQYQRFTNSGVYVETLLTGFRTYGTLSYTSEGELLRRYDVCTHTQLPDFAMLSGRTLYALRLLPPGDGSGGLLVAAASTVLRLDSAGNIVQSYDLPAIDQWFALSLDPNGRSFWSADLGRSFARFDIATGAAELGPLTISGS